MTACCDLPNCQINMIHFVTRTREIRHFWVSVTYRVIMTPTPENKQTTFISGPKQGQHFDQQMPEMDGTIDSFTDSQYILSFATNCIKAINVSSRLQLIYARPETEECQGGQFYQPVYYNFASVFKALLSGHLPSLNMTCPLW